MDLKTYVCRCCLSSVSDLIHLSAPMSENTSDDEVLTILQCLQNCTDITETEDFLMPQNICQLCFSDLKVSYYFRNKCQHSDKLLRQQFMSQKVNLKEEPEFEKVDIKIEVEDEDEAMQMQIKEEQKDLDSDDNDDEAKNSTSSDFNTKFQKRVSNKQKEFICDICEKTYKTKLRLKEHFNTHTGKKPYKCDVCNNEYSIKHSYQTHLKRHTQAKQYPCEFCDKVFYKKSAVDTHRILHTGKTIKCPDCDKMFCRTIELLCHQRSHTNDRPYKCDKCSNSYRQKSDLNFHMHTHSNVKYPCEICGREYIAPGTLKVHMKSHQKVLPFNCMECDKGFIKKYSYRLHLKRCHDIDLDNLPKPNDNKI